MPTEEILAMRQLRASLSDTLTQMAHMVQCYKTLSNPTCPLRPDIRRNTECPKARFAGNILYKFQALRATMRRLRREQHKCCHSRTMHWPRHTKVWCWATKPTFLTQHMPCSIVLLHHTTETATHHSSTSDRQAPRHDHHAPKENLTSSSARTHSASV